MYCFISHFFSFSVNIDILLVFMILQYFPVQLFKPKTPSILTQSTNTILQVADKSMMLPESLRNTTGKMTRSDFHASVLPVLTCLAPYHTHLDPQLQQKIIKCIIKFGLGEPIIITNTCGSGRGRILNLLHWVKRPEV